MKKYRHILVAIDLTEEAPEVLESAQTLAGLYGASLSVLTVIRPLTYAYTGIETATMGQALMNFEVEAEASARKRLESLCAPLGIPADRRHIVFGIPAPEVRNRAKSLGADLIVMGSHGRHGLGLILGSTANGVLHGAPCDVLTVRI